MDLGPNSILGGMRSRAERGAVVGLLHSGEGLSSQEPLGGLNWMRGWLKYDSARGN